MSRPAVTDASPRWPAWLAPLASERPGRGDLRRAETTILVLIGLFLLVATINDTVRKIDTNHRLIADLHTWRTITGHDYRNLSVEQDLKGYSTREIVCGNTRPGPPGEHVQICLVMTGPVVHGLRSTHGGYYLPPRAQDLPRNRYGCFGAAASGGFCGPTGVTAKPKSLSYEGE
ncbi:MAG TPA: hypothetical protein VIC05_05650 [Solirubrobacteraceae bacterium]|jgi:hypothetical protein